MVTSAVSEQCKYRLGLIEIHSRKRGVWFYPPVLGGKGLRPKTAIRDLSGLVKSAREAFSSLLARKKRVIPPVLWQHTDVLLGERFLACLSWSIASQPISWSKSARGHSLRPAYYSCLDWSYKVQDPRSRKHLTEWAPLLITLANGKLIPSLSRTPTFRGLGRDGCGNAEEIRLTRRSVLAEPRVDTDERCLMWNDLIAYSFGNAALG